MRQILLIPLIAIHLLGYTEISQVFKLPHLIDHYFEHLQLDRNLSFITFLSMHYGGDDGTNADNDKDEKLPCRHNHHNTLTLVSCQVVPANSFVQIVTVYNIVEFEEVIQTNLPSKHSQSLFRPPRIS